MIYSEKTRLALRVAYHAHQGNVDKSGVPYIFHAYHLAEQMKSEDAVIVALLHDVAEDTQTTLADLEKMGFSPPVIEALRLLTHEKNTPYMDYIQALKDHDLARCVKIADLRHNMDKDRKIGISEADQVRSAEKYAQALAVLEAEEEKKSPAAFESRDRLQRFEKVLSLLRENQRQVETELERLKQGGNVKSYRFKELLAAKLSNERFFSLFHEAGIDGTENNKRSRP